MRAWRTGSRRSTGDRAEAEGLPIWAPRSRGRLRRQILIWVGVVLVGLAAVVLVAPVDRSDDGHECGGAPAAAAALGVDTAARGDGDACRFEARSTVLFMMLLFLLPGALLLWRQW
jgi:hypothetical protein